jgi:predicted DNA-binding protein with PD1-like motif
MNIRSFLAVFVIFAVGATALAEKTRREVTKATTPADDAKANSPAIPESMATVGKFERVFVFRFKHKTDLLGGIEELVQKNKIKNAVILSGIGSVTDYQVHTVTNRTFPSKNVYTKDTDAPADLVSINGYVFDGRVHAHMTLVDTEKAFGGHLEPETHVFTFAVVTLAELSGEMDLSRFDDKTYR